MRLPLFWGRFATSMADRMSFLRQLRALVVSALVEAGHQAEAIGTGDKVEINGKKYDLFKGARKLGGRAQPHLLQVG